MSRVGSQGNRAVTLGIAAIALLLGGLGCSKSTQRISAGLARPESGDGLPRLGWESPLRTVAEGSGKVILAASLDRPSDTEVSVPYTLLGTASFPEDHDSPATGRLVIPAGQTRGEISFTLADDLLNEPQETLVLSLGAPSSARLSSARECLVTIADDDPQPLASFLSEAQAVSETVGTADAIVVLSAPSAREVRIPYRVSGTASYPEDHDLLSGLITIPAGELSATLSLNILSDGEAEDDEDVILELGTPTAAYLDPASTHAITITEAGVAPVVQWTALRRSEGESAGQAILVASLNTPAREPITVGFTVGGTASAEDHALRDGSITFLPGSAREAITLEILDDSMREPDETVVITLAPPGNAELGAVPQVTVTIRDDDYSPTGTGASSESPTYRTLSSGARR
jgi:hypothetical protein